MWELIHCDIWEIFVEPLGGSYFVCFIDSFSKTIGLCAQKGEHETFYDFKKLKALVEPNAEKFQMF